LSLKLTEGYSALEQRIESLLRSAIERGTINAHVRIIGARDCAGSQINTAVLQSYMKQIANAVDTLDDKPTRRMYASICSRFTPDRLVSLPGVIVTENEHDDTRNEKTWTLLEQALREALDALQNMRKTEGESMAKDLTANVETLRQLIGDISELSPRVAPLYRQKLKERIEKAMAEQLGGQPEGLHPSLLSDADFIRELAVFADRCDVSEELVRFQSHLEQFTSAMQSKERCGRKLDFLTQELFREVNTIGSKANDADITKYVVEAKTVIERIREMVQNVE
jgi:uncharacterized protein (TIGR00255 family)